jgi:nucleoside-diphosphate-sugar epimerase
MSKEGDAMRYFVTGATGFIGGRVAGQLIEAAHEVVALVRDPTRAGELAAMGASLSQGDVCAKESMRAGMAGVDGVFHVAGWYRLGARDQRPAQRINVEGTRNVLELMQELGVPKGVYTSTVAVYSDTHGKLVDETYRYDGPHINEYDRTKWVAHHEVARPMMEQGLPLVIVLPGAVYGPGDHSTAGQSFRQYLRRRLPVVAAGTRLCWTHVDDVARGHLLAMEKGRPGEEYFIGGPPHSLEEAFDLAEKITGIPAPRLRLRPGLVRFLARVMGVVGKVIPVPATFSADNLRAVAGVSYIGSNEKARRELGYSVRPLEEGLRETLEHVAGELGVRL